MHRCVSTLAMAAMLFGVTAPLSADTITLTGDRRTTIVLANTSDASGADRHTSTAEGFDALTSTALASTGTSSGASSATLLSSLDLNHLTGNGTAAVEWNTLGMADYSASSTFGISFSLASAMSFVFNGTFAGSSSNTGAALVSGGQSRWFIGLGRLGGGGLVTVFNDSGINSTATSRRFNGLLEPGLYNFVVDGAATGFNTRDGGQGTARTDFDFTLDLTAAEPPASPTPEPASALLLATGALGLWRARRAGKA